jgi:hypothetical protein
MKMSGWDVVLGEILGGALGTVLIPIPGVGTAIGADAGEKVGQEFDGQGSTQPQAVLAKPGPITISPSTSPTTPTSSSSGNQGLAAQAAAADATVLKDYNNVMAELDQNQVSVSSVNAEAQAASVAVQDLLSAMSSETAELKSTTNVTTINTLMGLIEEQNGQILTILEDQNNIAQAETQKAYELSQQYASVANNNSSNNGNADNSSSGAGSSDNSSSGAGSSDNSSSDNSSSDNSSSGAGSSGAGSSDNGSSNNGSSNNGSSNNGSSTCNTDPAAELAAEEDSGADSDIGSEMPEMMESLLPEMMMPAMMIPSMTSGLGANSMGARQADSTAPQGAQLASDTTSSGGSPNPKTVNASSTDNAGGGGQTQPGAQAGTQPASVQPVGNSNSGALPAGSNTDVKLPDGTTIHAPNAQAANAVRAALNGASSSDAYQQAGVTLPPPGTPVLNPVAPGDLQAGDVGVWKDHQVLALGNGKVLVSGQLQPESSVGSSPDFLGWMRPTQQSSAQPAAPAPTEVPAPAASTPAPALAGAAPSAMQPATPQ